MTPGVVTAHGISKAYGRGDARVAALVDVSLTVCSAALTAVVGPSGSGKSTLLHCLSGIAVPDEGVVRLGERDLAVLSDDERAAVRREQMGFVFQRGNLVPSLTVAENVSAGLVLQKRSRAAVAEGVRRALAQVGLQGRDGAFPAELSGGELQRVALARALATSPAVLWADEPTGALDRESANSMLGLLRDAARGGAAVVVVSHDPEVAAVADTVVRLQDGRLLA